MVAWNCVPKRGRTTMNAPSSAALNQLKQSEDAHAYLDLIIHHKIHILLLMPNTLAVIAGRGILQALRLQALRSGRQQLAS